jgi:SH3-like domain-containing protein
VSVDLDLDAEMLVALGAFTEGRDSALSPWHGVESVVSGAVRARLAQAGVIDGGELRSELRPTLAAMATATATTTLRLTGTGALIEYVTWVSNDHAPVGLSTITSTGRFRLEDPAPSATVVAAVAGLIGRSGLRSVDMTVDLPINDGLVLATIIDLQRRAILRGVAAGEPASDEVVDRGQLQTALNDPPVYGFSFVGAIRRTCSIETSSAVAGLSESLALLSRQGLISADSSGVRLAGGCDVVPRHFAAITSVIELGNACDTGADGLARVGFTCVQAGVSDLMTVEWLKSGIHLETVCAEDVVGYIDLYLCRPGFAQESAPAPQTPAWRPTHLAPAAGMAAWDTPNPAGAPVARIDPGVELQLLEISRDWAHIACANGWSAWVDARTMELRPPPAVSAATSAPRPTPSPTARTHEPVPTTAVPTSAWQPTHVVPQGGASAWAKPDRVERPVAQVDPRVEVQVIGRYREWANLRCSNGWSSWVDGRVLEPLPSDPASTPVPSQVAGGPGSAQTGGVSTSAWRPTHFVPDGGISAWTTPDPAAAPVTTIDPGVEVQLIERSGDWARISCSNGWSAWVDGRAVVPL